MQAVREGVHRSSANIENIYSLHFASVVPKVLRKITS
jgi:hypothetical protein